MRTTQIAQYALRLTYSQVYLKAGGACVRRFCSTKLYYLGTVGMYDYLRLVKYIDQDNIRLSRRLVEQREKQKIDNSLTVAVNKFIRPASREKMMTKSAVALAAIGLGLSTFSVRQMILHQTRRV